MWDINSAFLVFCVNLSTAVLLKYIVQAHTDSFHSSGSEILVIFNAYRIIKKIYQLM